MFKNILAIIAFVFAFGVHTNAQEKPSKNQKAEIQVSGVCKMCKKRIESSLLEAGVKLADWKAETGMLSVIYNARKISEDSIHNVLNRAGHDTEKQKAADENYKSLPKCCAYRDGVKVH